MDTYVCVVECASRLRIISRGETLTMDELISLNRSEPVDSEWLGANFKANDGEGMPPTDAEAATRIAQEDGEDLPIPGTFESMTRDELRTFLISRGVTVTSKMNKTDMVKAASELGDGGDW